MSDINEVLVLAEKVVVALLDKKLCITTNMDTH